MYITKTNKLRLRLIFGPPRRHVRRRTHVAPLHPNVQHLAGQREVQLHVRDGRRRLRRDRHQLADADFFGDGRGRFEVLVLIRRHSKIVVSEVDHIFEIASADQPLQATVNLEEQTLCFESISFPFEVNPAIKEKLLLGMDDIDESLTQIEQIKIFEKTHNAQLKK